jgi:hypothetical protein
MNAYDFARRGFATGLAAAALAGATPVLAIDLLEGLAPADFHSPSLAQAEARALAPQRIAEARDAAPGANPLARTDGATTLTDLGVGSGATELRVTGESENRLLAQTTAEERRLLGTLAVLGSLDALGDDGGILDLDDLLEDLDDAVADLPGGLLDDLDDLLGGAPVTIGGDDGVVIDLLDGDGITVDVPAEELQDILDDLPVVLPIRLPILLQ